MDEDLDTLREQSTRASSVYDDLEGDDEGSSQSVLGGFTPQQRLILALLIFLDVIALACAVLLIAGVFSI